MPTTKIIADQLERLEQKIRDASCIVFGEYDRVKLFQKTCEFIKDDRRTEADVLTYEGHFNDHRELDCGLAVVNLILAEVALNDGNIESAISSLVDASYLAGASCTGNHVLSERAAKAASARHVETNSIKLDAVTYYATTYADNINALEKNKRGKAKDEAAYKLTKQLPIQFRTARRYIDEYHKQNTAS